LKTKVIVGTLVVIVVILVSVGYYVMMSQPPPSVTTATTATSQEPSEDTLVPSIVVATATPDSDPIANNIARLATDDINQAGLGLTAKPYLGDSNTVIYGSLYYGEEPGGYNAYDIGYNELLGTPDRLADP
jgi:hypothetical protein